MNLDDLVAWLRSHIAERRRWVPMCTADLVWINWASRWLYELTGSYV